MYQININYSSIYQAIAFWIMLSIGMILVVKKLGRGDTKLWQYFIPGFRYYRLGSALGIEKDGLVLCILEIVVDVLNYSPYFLSDENVSLILTLFAFAAIVALFIYQLHLILTVRKIFGLSGWWVLVAIFADGLAMIYAGLSKKVQPTEEFFKDEDWQAGTQPVEFEAHGLRHKSGRIPDKGLIVNVRERTVKDFNRKRYLLKDIRLEIPNKSLVLLLGGSGAGKTTLINAITGYEKADADVYLNGTDVYRNYDEVKYRIGFVPQQNLMRMYDTVDHTIKDAADLRLPVSMTHSEKKKKIQEVMEMLGLTAGTDGLVGKKSGGWLRRISIAMELVSDPELFILDEPDSGLDGVIARELFERLRDIADENKIVIAITHTPDRVADLFDKVIVLGRDSGRVGQLCFYGDVDEAKAFFGKDTMEGIVMSINSKDAGGEGRADEFIKKFIEYREKKESGQTEQEAAG